MSLTTTTGDAPRFTFVAPMFNASATLGRMLHSLCGQSYANWRLVLIDDLSTPDHRSACESLIYDHFARLPDEPAINVIWNDVKRWEVANVLCGIERCDDDDIVCRIDADDWLTDLDALAIIAEAYQRTGCEALWTAHRWGYSDRNISGPLPAGADPYRHPWVSSHLKTFRKRLINGVNDRNFRGEDGEYVRRAGDQAIYLPILAKATNRIFLPRCMYHYTIDDVPATYQTPDARFQRDEALFIRARGFVV